MSYSITENDTRSNQDRIACKMIPYRDIFHRNIGYWQALLSLEKARKNSAEKKRKEKKKHENRMPQNVAF